MLQSVNRLYTRCAYVNRILPSCSITTVRSFKYQKEREENNRQQQRGRSQYRWYSYGAPLLGLSWLVTIKDLLGIETFKLDKDPLKEKIKQSWLHRKYGKYTDAIQVLEIALEEAIERKEEIPITRVYDEIANTYYQMGDNENAEKYFRITLSRLMELHKKRDSDQEFIGISLKLADIFAQKGELDNAEAGYKHCVRKQMQVLEEHQKKFSISHGALVEEKHLVDTHGSAYTDPIALFGMALETYAHFLVKYRDASRLEEAEEYMDEVMKISYQIFGANHFHTINLLNNFGAALIQGNHFEKAVRYLAVGIERILYVNECSSMMPGYYCNYAEALFHSGRKEEALIWAKRALDLSRSEEPRIRNYVEKFVRELQREANKGNRKTWWLF